MNEVVKSAIDKVKDRNDNEVLVEKMYYATRAAELYGALSSLAISNRLDLKAQIERFIYLTEQERRALFYWCAAEPDRRKKK